MKCNLVWIPVLCLACALAGAEEQVLGTYSAADFSAASAQTPAGVGVTPDAGASPGGGALKISFSCGELCEAMVFNQPLAGVENCVLWFEADFKVSANGTIFPAMWVTFPDGNSFYSRGMNQAQSGISGWQRLRIPFLLKKGQRPASVVMGAGMSGTGEVWIDHARLMRQEGGLAAPWNAGAWIGAAGGLFGGLAGLWGAAAGVLASRGRGRKFILYSGATILLLGAASLAGGVWAWMAGSPWDLYYPLLLCGVIILAVCGPLIPVLLRRHAQAEAQRMKALEQSEIL